MQLSILGSLEVTSGGLRVEIRGSRLRALLTRLALDAGRIVTIETLALALWEQEPPTDPANALQSLVSRLRRALPEPALLESRPSGYLLAIAPDDVDAHRFRTCARTGRAALRAGDPRAALSALNEGLALWRGEPLAELQDSPFAELIAADLVQERAAAVQDQLDAQVQLGRGPDVLAQLHELVEIDPLQERLVGLLMQALYDDGRQAEALALYEQTRRLLSTRLGADPSPALQEVHARMLRGEQRTPPPSVRTNLPAALTSFLGRQEEMQRLGAMLHAHRLITLVGPGGAGKTRLAVETAVRANDAGPVWLVELAPVTDAGDIAQAALDALDVRDAPQLTARRRQLARSAQEQLETILGAGPALIVLDNCEHLIEGAAHFSQQLLSRCPQLRILATSREPLSVTGEVLHPVAMLARPEIGDSPAQAAHTASVQLFLDRAQAASPGFVLDEHSVGAVIELCRRLDGLPLAIELAAARLRTMSVEQLAARLDDRFRLLIGGSRTAVARHRTLRAVVEWSWELLTEDERQLAERFSVFPGGATAQAALEVCLERSEGVADAQDALGALADKSLIQVLRRDSEQEPRYRMLETLREYGSERLADRGELLQARRAHARYYRDLAEHAEPLLRTTDQLQWLRQLDVERDNILAALRFAADDGDADTAIRIGAALAWYWMLKDSHSEAATWLQIAMDVPGESEPAARALVGGLQAVNAAASGLIDMNDSATLLQLLQALPSVDPLTGHPLLALLGPALALLAEDVEEYQRRFEENLAHPDPWTRGLLHLMQVQAQENFGNVEAMHLHLLAALELFRATGDRWGVATSLTSLGGLLLMEQDTAGAIDAYEEAARLSSEMIPDSRDNAMVLMQLAIVHSRIGEVDQAQALAARALDSAERSGSEQTLLYHDIVSAQLAWELGDADRAEEALARADTRVSQSVTQVPQIRAAHHAFRAQLAISSGELESVHDTLVEAFTLAVAVHDQPILASVAVSTAAWKAITGEPELGARLLGAGAGLRGSRDEGNPSIVWVTRLVQSRIGGEVFDEAYAQGHRADPVAATAMLRQALGLPDV